MGHTPLSHVCEDYTDDAADLYDKYLAPLSIDMGIKKNDCSHEWNSAAISVYRFVTQLSSFDVDLELLCRMICGEKYPPSGKEWLNPLISLLNSWTDVDKIDYILRDSKMSGAVLANLDSDRVINSFDIKDNDIIIKKSGFSVISQLIYGREALYLWLYTHHAVSYHHALIRRYIDYLTEKGIDFTHLFSVQGILDGADDAQLHSILHQYKNLDDYTQLLHGSIYDRQFYVSLWKTPFECDEILDERQKRKLLLDPLRLESDLVKDLGLPTYSMFAYEASFKPFRSAATNLWLTVGNKDSTYGELFYDSIYKKEVKIGSTPYIRVSPNIINRKNDIIEYVKNWKM